MSRNGISITITPKLELLKTDVYKTMNEEFWYTFCKDTLWNKVRVSISKYYFCLCLHKNLWKQTSTREKAVEESVADIS